MLLQKIDLIEKMEEILFKDHEVIRAIYEKKG